MVILPTTPQTRTLERSAGDPNVTDRSALDVVIEKEFDHRMIQ